MLCYWVTRNDAFIIILLQAYHTSPLEILLLFNICLVLQNMAVVVLEDEYSCVEDIKKAIQQLELAQKLLIFLMIVRPSLKFICFLLKYFRFFTFLSNDGDKTKFDPELASIQSR